MKTLHFLLFSQASIKVLFLKQNSGKYRREGLGCNGLDKINTSWHSDFLLTNFSCSHYTSLQGVPPEVTQHWLSTQLEVADQAADFTN